MTTPEQIKKLIDEKRYAEAESQAREAYARSQSNWVYAYWIGIAALLDGRPAEAEPWLRRAAETSTDAGPHAALGYLGKLLGRPGRAAHYRRAAELSPDDPNIRANYAEALFEAGQAAAAESQARAGLTRVPHHVACTAAMGKALMAQGRVDEALALLEQHFKASNDPDIGWILADVYLRTGRYQEGFTLYELRRRPRNLAPGYVVPQKLSNPEWTGDDLAGRRLLIVSEQGLGDTIQVMRYAAAMAARGHHISAVVPSALERLLASQAYLKNVYLLDAGIPRADYDCWVYAMSLPLRLGTPHVDVGPYIHLQTPLAPPRGQRRRPGSGSGPGVRVRGNNTLRIGVCWAGSTKNPSDALRSIAPERLAPLAQVPGVQLFSLQHGIEPSALPPFIAPPPRAIADLADTAELIAQMDLVITIDSAPAHLAGAMGREVWMLNRWHGDWRWGDSGETTHWYPTMRILRPPRAGDWDSVIAEAANRLRSKARLPLADRSDPSA